MVLAIKNIKLHTNVNTLLIHAMNVLFLRPHTQQGKFFHSPLSKTFYLQIKDPP